MTSFICSEVNPSQQDHSTWTRTNCGNLDKRNVAPRFGCITGPSSPNQFKLIGRFSHRKYSVVTSCLSSIAATIIYTPTIDTKCRISNLRSFLVLNVEIVTKTPLRVDREEEREAGIGVPSDSNPDSSGTRAPETRSREHGNHQHRLIPGLVWRFRSLCFVLWLPFLDLGRSDTPAVLGVADHV